jgi:putative aldouronate transport system permease protein
MPNRRMMAHGAAVAKRKRVSMFSVVNSVILGLIGLTVVYPFYNAILISFATEAEYVLHPFMLFPTNPVVTSYKFIFNSGWVINAYKSTLIIVIVGLAYSMLLTTSCAYALSKKYFPGKALILNLIIFTMFFSGGLIPFYLLVKGLGLRGTFFAVILPMGINTFYMLIMRNYFQSVPESLQESAKIDGANDLVILAKIIVPVSMPVIATIILFTTVGLWNEWFLPMLFLTDTDSYPLQLALRNILMTLSYFSSVQRNIAVTEIYLQSVKMACVVITVLPIMCFFPFLQKYFMKGIMLGALKG